MLRLSATLVFLFAGLVAPCAETAPPRAEDVLQRIAGHAAAAHSDALLIQHGGITLLSHSTHGAFEPVPLMSATKSVVALAIGLLITEGRLPSLDEPVSTLYPEWRQGRKRDITVRMLMDHTSGLQNVANAGVELEGAPDLVALALAAELASDPGTTFSYNNKATNLLAGIVERLAGQPIDAYVAERIFAPLGITAHAWLKDSAATPMGMAGLSLSAPDLAKLGRLVLDGGRAPDGTRLLDPLFVQALTAQSARSPDVGLLWWRIPAWERFVLDDRAAAVLDSHGVAVDVREAVLAAQGQRFDSRQALTAFLAERLGTAWQERYGAEITGRGIRLVDLFEQTRGPIQAYAANGFLGQFLVIVPEKDLVAVRQIHRRDDHVAQDDYAGFTADLIALADAL